MKRRCDHNKLVQKLNAYSPSARLRCAAISLIALNLQKRTLEVLDGIWRSVKQISWNCKLIGDPIKGCHARTTYINRTRSSLATISRLSKFQYLILRLGTRSSILQGGLCKVFTRTSDDQLLRLVKVLRSKGQRAVGKGKIIAGYIDDKSFCIRSLAQSNRDNQAGALQSTIKFGLLLPK
jgi:hypothetical protein